MRFSVSPTFSHALLLCRWGGGGGGGINVMCTVRRTRSAFLQVTSNTLLMLRSALLQVTSNMMLRSALLQVTSNTQELNVLIGIGED